MRKKYDEMAFAEKLERARAIALKSLDEMTDEEDAALTAAALADPDNLPADDLIRRKGRPPSLNPKLSISLRVDPEVVSRFKAEGPGWQSRMNTALRRAVGL